jgi:hypothetical protein
MIDAKLSVVHVFCFNSTDYERHLVRNALANLCVQHAISFNESLLYMKISLWISLFA